MKISAKFQTMMFVEYQFREVDPEALIQNPLHPSLMLRQKPSKVFDCRVQQFPFAEVRAQVLVTSLTLHSFFGLQKWIFRF